MAQSSKKIVFIGAGKVAATLALALENKRNIVQVYSPHHARKLADKLKCSYTNDLKKIVTNADIYIIAIKDDAIEGVCKRLKLQGKIVIHTSGSTDMNILKSVSDKRGVLWPMYSFTGKSNIAPGAPFFIEASDKKKTENELTSIVKELKGKTYYLNSEKRAKVHMTAVFVNNFPNHLMVIAEKLCKDAGVPFSLFTPLIKATFENVLKQSPALSQTGPASRNEKKIINQHLALLSKDKSHPDYKEIYEVLTQSIIKTSGTKKL